MTAEWRSSEPIVVAVPSGPSVRQAIDAVSRAAFSRHDEPPAATAFVLEDGAVVPRPRGRRRLRLRRRRPLAPRRARRVHRTKLRARRGSAAPARPRAPRRSRRPPPRRRHRGPARRRSLRRDPLSPERAHDPTCVARTTRSRRAIRGARSTPRSLAAPRAKTGGLRARGGRQRSSAAASRRPARGRDRCAPTPGRAGGAPSAADAAAHR
jgi:hypothetical protein